MQEKKKSRHAQRDSEKKKLRNMFSLVCVMLTVDPNKGKRKSRDQRYCEGSSESIKSARTYTAHNTEQSGLLRWV